MPTFYTLRSEDPAFDLQYGNMLCATLRTHPEVKLAAVVLTHEPGVLVVELDAPALTESGVRDLVRDALLQRAAQVAALLEGVYGMDAAGEDTRVFTVPPRP